MKFTAAAVALAATGSVLAQRPNDTSICDYYTTALFTNNTASNQYTLLTALVNTVVIGNYTSNMTAVPGILAPGEFNGTQVNLAPYFSGALASTNRGGSRGVSVNFLDGGGASPLMNNTPSNNASSNQQRLLTHLYSYFGALLNCSTYGQTGFPAYNGSNSQASVHRFMVLTPAENGYFIQQVALAAASFGVASSDIMAVGLALDGLFNYRCSPATVVIPSQAAGLQAICQDSTCPISPSQNCSAYPAPVSSPLPSGVSASASASASGAASSAAAPAASVASAVSSAVMGRW